MKVSPSLVAVDAALAHWASSPSWEESPYTDVLQIAARCGDGYFNVFIRPHGDCSVSRGQADFTGLDVRGGALCLDGSPVHAVSERRALEKFARFLQEHGDLPVVLVAHNEKTLHNLMYAIARHALCDTFGRLVSGFQTSAEDIRERLDLGHHHGGVGCSLEAVADKHLRIQYSAPSTAQRRAGVLFTAMAALGLVKARNFRGLYTWHPFKKLHGDVENFHEEWCSCREKRMLHQ